MLAAETIPIRHLCPGEIRVDRAIRDAAQQLSCCFALGQKLDCEVEQKLGCEVEQ